MRWVRLRRTALRAHPQMNTSTQPPEGAGRSRSKAKAKQSKANARSKDRSLASLDSSYREMRPLEIRPAGRPPCF
ncbi:hypothetical protein EMIT0194MI4_40298 [Pseudomonas sp. IT-194MI4]